MSPEALETTLTQRTSTIGATLCADFLTAEQSKVARDQFAMTLYVLLFEYIVSLLNQRLNADSGTMEQTGKSKWDAWIALFDFGGLENSGIYTGESNGHGNRLFQFLTNFADERLSEWIFKQIFSFSDEVAVEMGRQNQYEAVDQTIEALMSTTLSCLNIFVHPVNGLIPILDKEALREGERNEDPADAPAQLVQLYNRVHQVQQKVLKT